MITSISKITCLVTSGIFMTPSALAVHVMWQGPNNGYRDIGTPAFGTPFPLAG